MRIPLGDVHTGQSRRRDVGRRDAALPRRLAADPSFEVRIDATHGEVANDDAPRHEVMLRILIRW